MTPHQILLQWTQPSAPLQDVVVERRQGDSPFAAITTLAGDAVSYTDLNLPVVTSFQYRVQTDATDGSTTYSNIASASTLPTALSSSVLQQSPITQEQSTALTPLASSNGLAYFTEVPFGGGAALLRTDGTSAGTFAVGQVVPGYEAGSYLAVGSTLYFASNNQLWKTDGTVAGTVLVATINPSGLTPNIHGLTEFHGSVYFVSSGLGYGAHLWETDGTSAGTSLVKAFASNVDVDKIAATDDRLFLSVVTNQQLGLTHALWTSDGTDAGTASLTAVAPAVMYPAANRLYFTTSAGQLWITDGTSGGTAELKDSGVPADTSVQFSKLGSDVYFLANDVNSRLDVWGSDGTAAGTQPVFQLPQSQTTTTDVQLAAENGKLFLAGPGGQLLQTEIWVSDGSAGGMTALQIIVRATGTNAVPADFTAAGGITFFSAMDASAGPQLWKTDGTPPGTLPVRSFAATLSNDAGEPRGLLAAGNRLMFSADDGIHGRELWVSDSTSVGTSMIADASMVSHPAHPDKLTAALGRLFFTAANDDTNAGRFDSSVWASDGTATGTIELYVGRISGLFQANGAVYFVADNDAQRAQTLMRTDGTLTGTVAVTDLPGPSSDLVLLYGVVPGEFFFGIGSSTYVSDGTGPGTQRITQGPGPKQGAFGLNPPGAVPYATQGDDLYYLAQASSNSFELWRTDGTGTGTVRVGEVDNTESLEPRDLVASNGKLLFEANNPFLASAPYHLYAYNPASQSTQDLHEFESIGKIVDANGMALSFANDGVGGEQLWKTDGTPQGTLPFLHVQGGWVPPVVVGASLYLVGFSSNLGTLYRSDGTDSGTVPLHASYGLGSLLWIVGTTVFFLDNKALWATDGSPLTTRQVDISTGQFPSWGLYAQAATGNRFYYAPFPPVSPGPGELRFASIAALDAPTEVVVQTYPADGS